MTPTTEIQREPFASEDLTPYQGSWVAIRNGIVVAHALDPIELRDREDVRGDDLLLLVPLKARELLIL